MKIELWVCHASCKNQEKFRLERNTQNLPTYNVTIEGGLGTNVLACEACGDRIVMGVQPL